VRAVAQVLGLMEVTIRDWVRPVYGSYADNIAQTSVLLSISFIVLSALFVLAGRGVDAVVRFQPRALVYLIGAIAFAVLGSLFFDSGRADEFAAEARDRWPRLASNAKVLSAGVCLFSVLSLVCTVLWAPTI
jgi:hypothetical protein